MKALASLGPPSITPAFTTLLMHASLPYLSLCDVSQLVKARLVSPVELAQILLNRIEALDGQVHSFISITRERALQEARQAEAEIFKGQWRGPLHGIPVAYKDNIETRNVRTTAHSRSMMEHVPSADAEVVQRLAQAGAICMGKLSLQELAYGSPGDDDAFPSPRNPWSLAHSPGGSSSGSGAAVAAGFVYGAVGTDTGGSIRHPAAVCGVVGLKPSFDLVSTQGTIPLSPTQDHVGPLTRGVMDNAVMLQAMTGLSPGKPRKSTSDLRIGIPFDLIDTIGLEASVQEAFDTTLGRLKSLGASIVPVPTPMAADFNALGTRIILYEAWARYGAALQANPELFGAAFRARVKRGAGISSRDYESAVKAREGIEHHYARLFASGVDAIVSPGREEPAMTMERLRSEPLGVRGQFTRIYNLARIPALVMPMGFSPEGLPLSVQIAAAFHDEASIYGIAAALERDAGWTGFHPDLERQMAGVDGGCRNG